jgi:outer membrane protein OmpA-like peptidoglycan-associated protein
MKKLGLFLLLIFCTFSIHTAFAQSADDNLVKLGDEMYGFGDKKDALAVYLQAIEVNPENITANYMAGKCYLETVGKELSVNFLIKAYDKNHNVAPDVLFKIGSGFQFGGKFNDAIKYYTLYKENINEAKAKILGSTIKDEVIKTERRIFECQNGAKYYSNMNHFKIENIKDVVNSEYPDYAPSVNADETTMIFTSRRAGGVGKNKDIDNEYFEDIWITKKNDKGEWDDPKNLGAPINSESHDASIGLSADGNKIFIYKPDNGGDIFVTEIMPDGKWGVPTNISSNVNTKYNEPSVSITKDGKILYFSSNKPGGFGGFDIYKSDLDKSGKWGKAQNMGSIFNTEYDEDAPFIDLDGKTLYFSSRGHKGMGGYDLYKCMYDSIQKRWSEPINMGYPLNSPDDDIYFVITRDGKSGYYASAKGDGYGDKDIYKIYFADPIDNDDPFVPPVEEKPVKKDTVKAVTTTPGIVKKDTIAPIVAKKEPILEKIAEKKEPEKVVEKKEPVEKPLEETKPLAKAEPKPVEEKPVVKAEPKVVEKKEPPVVKEIVLYPSVLKGVIYDKYTSAPLSATVTITDLKGNFVASAKAEDDGNYEIELPSKVSTKYILTANRNGYIYSNINVSVPASAKVAKVVNRDVALKKTNLGQIFVLRNIYFDFDKANIKKESFPYMDNLYRWLKANPNVSLEIGGHTDDLGLDSYNKILSQRRVDAVMRYLTAKGIHGERLVAIGYGEERPLASNDDEQEGREINRRTEFKITKQ